MRPFYRVLLSIALLLALAHLLVRLILAPSSAPKPPQEGPAVGQRGAGKSGVDLAPKPPQTGPAVIHLTHATTLNLPAGFIFLDKYDTQTHLRQVKTVPQGGELGVVLKPDRSWHMIIGDVSRGHIRDDDANPLDADAFMKKFHERLQEGNEERRKMGFDTVEQMEWAEKPHYDATRHRLTWAVTLQGTQNTQKVAVNYFTRILGRSSHLALDVMMSREDFEADRKDLEAVIDAVSFNAGQRYSDYQPGTDANYGISVATLF